MEREGGGGRRGIERERGGGGGEEEREREGGGGEGERDSITGLNNHLNCVHIVMGRHCFQRPPTR